MREVRSYLAIDYCLELTSLRGLERLERVDAISIRYAPKLVDLKPLAALTSAGGGIWIAALHALTDLRGLDALESIDGWLLIEDSDNLESLAGLQGLRTVGDDLEIINNPSLISLRGLANLESVGGDLVIFSNPQLPQSQIDEFLARVDVGGRIEIEGNGP
jgi:hypothetical protein